MKTIEPSEILLFDKYGHFKYSQNSEAVSDGILLFPSKELQDWNKVFDIGDVLVDDYYIQSFLDYIRGNATEEDINNFIDRFKCDEK